MPIVEVPYGKSVHKAEASHGIHITKLTTAPPSTEQSAFKIITNALAHPIQSPPLQEFLSPSDRVTVIISDKTRQCRTDVFLPVLLDGISDSGIPRESVTIIFATGTHPKQSEQEQRAIVGDRIFDGYRIVEHDSRNPDAVQSIGVTRFGTDVLLNKHVALADKVIAAGTIIHHYFAGFGGGAKLFFPGVAAYSSAVQNHKRTIKADGAFDPRCRDGNVVDNPVTIDIQDAIRFFPPTFYFASILDPSGKIAHAVCGDLQAAHTAGCGIVDAMYRVPIDRLADLTIVSAGGYPKDINFIQAHKALHRAHYATKKGGTIIFVAECIDGTGNDSILDWFRISASELPDAIRTRYSMNAHTALAMRKKSLEYKIYCLSSLPDSIVQLLGMIPVSNLQNVLDLVCSELPANAVVYQIDNGSLVVPTIQ